MRPGAPALTALLAATLTIAAPTDDEVRGSLSRALPALEREGRAWLDGLVPVQDGQGCVSCHHVGFALWSHAEAARAGVAIPRDRIGALADDALAFLSRPDKPRAVSTSQVLLARAHEMTADPGRIDRMLEQLRDAQRADGSWRARGQFPDQRRDEAESDAAMTSWALLALRDAAREPEATARATAWLATGPARSGATVESLAARLLVERDPLDRDATLHRLLDARNADGGWPWRAGEPSNAFSTGQALYALARLDEPDETHAAIDAGRAYLVTTQAADGRWEVPSALISTKPGEAPDVIYDYWGSAWAAIGLARSLDAER